MDAGFHELEAGVHRNPESGLHELETSEHIDEDSGFLVKIRLENCVSIHLPAVFPISIYLETSVYIEIHHRFKNLDQRGNMGCVTIPKPVLQ